MLSIACCGTNLSPAGVILVRLINAIAIILMMLALVLPRTPALSAEGEAPEIVVLKYLRAVYILPSTEMFSAASYPDQSYCTAYALLSEESRAKVTPQDFLSYARLALTSFVQAEMIYGRIKGTTARVTARYSVDVYRMSTAFTISLAKDSTDSRFENWQLTKDADGWRIVLDALQLPRVLNVANAYRTLVKQDVRFGLPPETCGPPTATK